MASIQAGATTFTETFDNDTPGDQSDDTAAHFLGPKIPLLGEGWISYDFDVPSQETSLPAE